MSLVVNNNMMAANTARNLNAHYGRLATSTQRLSSGLRINSAADDAAGLAIRELQRADIAALHQGARNANDAISMIQVADGSLGIIDEKLIRMKELAEQAATGTYDSTQRLMIESEYQAMASEITRIANATDFNGTKLLDGTLAGDHDGSKLVSEGKMKIHFGTGNDSAEDYYYVEIGECTSEAFGLGNNSTWQDVQRRGIEAFKESMMKQIKNDSSLSDADKAAMLANMEEVAEQVNDAIKNATDPAEAYKLWAAGDSDPDNYLIAGDQGFLVDGKNKYWVGNSDLMSKFLAAGAGQDFTKIAAQADAAGTLPETGQGVVDAIKGSITKPDLTQEPIVQDDPDADAGKDKVDALVVEWLDKITATATANGYTGTPAAADLRQAISTAITTDVNDLKDKLDAGTDLDQATDLDAIWATINNTIDAELANGHANQAAENNKAANAANPPADQTTTKPETVDDVAAAITGAVNVPAVADVTTEDELKDAVDQMIDEAVKAAMDNGYTPEAAEKLRGELEEAIDRDALAAKVKDNTLGQQDLNAIKNTTITNVVTANADLAAAAEANKQANKDLPAATTDTLDKFWNSLRTTEQQKLQYAWGQAALYNLANAPMGNTPEQFGIGATIGFGADIDLDDPTRAQAIIQQALKDMQAKVGHMDFAGHTIETQEDAQMALTAINDAIVSKDKIRAHLGAAQNRLENTVSNLNIQAENLQAAESRISDVDVATEMTQFVRNQILTQSAVAMLSQANSLPQMAMQLIGG